MLYHIILYCIVLYCIVGGVWVCGGVGVCERECVLTFENLYSSVAVPKSTGTFFGLERARSRYVCTRTQENHPTSFVSGPRLVLVRDLNPKP